MTDLIERQAAIDQLHQSYNLLDAEQRLEDLPSAQPERKEGKWRLNREGNWACPFCEFDPYHDNMKGMNFCPNCGAEMVKGEDDAK